MSTWCVLYGGGGIKTMEEWGNFSKVSIVLYPYNTTKPFIPLINKHGRLNAVWRHFGKNYIKLTELTMVTILV